VERAGGRVNAPGRREAERWLDAVWSRRAGYFSFAFGVDGRFSAQGKYEFEHWHDRHGRWPDDRDRFLAEALERAGRDDVYVAPYLRSKPSRKKGTALPSDLVYADVDELRDNLRGFERLLIGPGGFVVSSGEGLHAYLRLPEPLEPAELEEWNRRLAARLCADAGWAENKVLRLPGTWNHKERARGGSSRAVAFVDFEPQSRDWRRTELAELLPELPTLGSNGAEPIPATPRGDPLPSRIEERLHEEPGSDRSRQLYSFVGLCLQEGLTDGETLAVALEYKPALDKYGRRAGAEIERVIRKHREGSHNSFPPPLDAKAGGNESERGGGLPFAPLGPLLEQAPPEPPWLLPGYLARFAVTLLAGRPKVGKSTLTCALLASIAKGAPFVGLETSRSGVLLLTEERRDTLAEKARILRLISFRHGASPIGGGNELAPVHALMRHDAGATPWREVVRQAMAHCAQHELALLVVDTFDRWTGLRGEAENAAGAVNEALEPLQYAAASGLAVLIVSHQRKSSGEFGEAVRGSNALTGGVDVVLELERPSRTLQLGGHARVLRAVSRFSSTPEELYVELDEHNFVPIESPEQVKADAERERVLAALDGAGESATAELIGEELDLPKSTVRRHLRTLLERGLVTRSGRGKKNDPYVWQLRDEEAA
jgi:DNA-binding transcriptional ArsR family regulator